MVSRSRTAWASATPIHPSANAVTAMPEAPARGWMSAIRNVSGTVAASAPSTASGPPRCAATSIPAKPMNPARRTGCAPESMVNASGTQTQPSRISPTVNGHSPSTTIATAKAMAGIAAITRAARSELWLDRLAATEPALPGAVLLQRGLERLAGEVGPQLVAEDELGVGGLPQQVVGQPLLAAGADHEVGVVHLGRVQQVREGPLAPSLVARRRVEDLRARPVVEGDIERDAVVARGRRLRPPHPL